MILWLVSVLLLVLWIRFRMSLRWAANMPRFGPWFAFLKLAMSDRAKTTHLVLHEAAKSEHRIALNYHGFNAKVFLLHPDCIKKVINTPCCLKKPSFFRFFGWGSGLVTADVESWKTDRKLLNPAFGPKMLKSFVPIFVEVGRDFAKCIGENLGKGEFNLLEYSERATLDSICATSFGVKVEAQTKNIVFSKYLQRTHEIVFKRIKTFIYQPDILFRLSSYFREDQFVRKKCLEFGEGLIERRKELYKEESEEPNELCEDEDFKKPQIFVDFLLNVSDKGRKFTDLEIRNHVFTMISAGSETTALAVSHTVLFLAIHKDVQQKVVDELQSVFFSEEVEIDYDQLGKLSYLEMVIKESLRVAPSIPNFARECTEDVEVDGFIVPKGTEFFISTMLTHRRKDLWGPNPRAFDPDRFLPENMANRHPYAWMAFSLGSRNCIGQRYAMLSLKIMLIHLLRAYRFKTHLTWRDIKYQFDVHLHITTPHWVEIEPRDFYKNNNNSIGETNLNVDSS